MTMIPFAPAAAPSAPTSGPSAPARASEELGAVFSALVDALTEELLPTEASSPSDEPAAPDAAPLGTEQADVDPTVADAAAVVAMLLAGPAQPEPAPASVTVDDAAAEMAGTATPAGDTAAPEVPGDADGPGETTTTMEPAVEAGPVPRPSAPPEDAADAPVGPDTVDATVEPGSSETAALEPGAIETAPPSEGADAAGDTLSPAGEGDAVEPATVTTDDGATGEPAGEPDDGNTTSADRDPDAGVAERPELGRTDGTSIRPGVSGPASDADTTAAAVGSASPSQSAPADAVSTAGAPARPTPAALPDQLVTVLAPLRRGPDGTHRVTIQLRPDELGEVQIDVQVRGNEIALSVRADLPGTVDLLRASIAELRAQLEAAGFQAGDLDVAGHGADGATDDQRSADADGPATDHAAGSPTGPDAAAAAAQPPLSATGLDLRL